MAEDLAGTSHFRGRANRWPDGTYYLDGLPGEQYVWNGGFVWSDAFLWSDVFVELDAFVWSDSLTETMSINHWVDQE